MAKSLIPKPLQKYLAKLDIKAEAVVHKTVFTAYDLAKTTALKLDDIAKTILLKVEPYYEKDGKKFKYIIAALPASHQLDLAKLKKLLKVKKVSIPQEKVMAKLYKVKAGALTAFGKIHDETPVVVDKALLKSKKILARSGSFTASLFMKGKDFLKASEGKVMVFAKRSKKK